MRGIISRPMGTTAVLNLTSSGEALLTNLRKPPAGAACCQLIQRRRRRGPLTFSHDDPRMVDHYPAIVSCIQGKDISRFACARRIIHRRGARYVAGGFEVLRVAGVPLAPPGD